MRKCILRAMTEPTLLKPREAAQRLNVDTETLRKWVARGVLTCVLLPSGHRRYRAADIDALLATGPEAA